MKTERWSYAHKSTMVPDACDRMVAQTPTEIRPRIMDETMGVRLHRRQLRTPEPVLRTRRNIGGDLHWLSLREHAKLRWVALPTWARSRISGGLTPGYMDACERIYVAVSR